MIRFRMGLALLGLLLAVGIWSQWQTHAIQQPIARTMEAAAALALEGHWEAAAQKAAEAEAAWQRSRSFTAAIADHGPMEDIESLQSQLPALAAAHNRSAYAAACSTLSRRIQAIADAQKIDFGSLF